MVDALLYKTFPIGHRAEFEKISAIAKRITICTYIKNNRMNLTIIDDRKQSTEAEPMTSLMHALIGC